MHLASRTGAHSRPRARKQTNRRRRLSLVPVPRAWQPRIQRGSGGRGRSRNVTRPPPPNGAAQIPDGHCPQRRSPRNSARPGRRSRCKQPITSPAHPDHPRWATFPWPLGQLALLLPCEQPAGRPQRPPLGTNSSGLPRHSSSLSQRTTGRRLAWGARRVRKSRRGQSGLGADARLELTPPGAGNARWRRRHFGPRAQDVPVHSAPGAGDSAHSDLRATTTT
jgi:hypothetical protein